MKKVIDLNKVGKLIGIIGAPGTGKTSVIKNFEGRKLVVSFDASYEVLEGVEDLDVVVPELSDYESFEKFIEGIDKVKDNYDLIVFDNITQLQGDWVDGWSTGKIGNNKNGMAAYGELQRFARELSRWAINQTDKIVMFTAHGKTNEETGKFAVTLNAQVDSAMRGLAYVVGRTVRKGDQYAILLQDDEDVAKNRTKDKRAFVENKNFWKFIKGE